MQMINTNKAIKCDEARRKYAAEIADEHYQLALDRAILLDFVYLAAANKRRSGIQTGKYSNSRDDLRNKADAILAKLNL